MHVVPYLNFDGTCEEAFRFYERILDGKIVALVKAGDMPEMGPLTEEWKGRTIHACLVVGNTELMASDCPPGPFEKPRNIYVSLHLDDPTRAERIFHALADGGKVEMPIGETPWAHRYGIAVDRFGTPWMINCQKAG
jgi:PhnB protein